MLLVVLGHGADAVLGQELGLVEHALQDLLESVLAHQRQKQAVVFATTLHAGDVTLGDICLVLDEPVQPALEGWELVDNFRLQSQDSVQWNEANQRPDG